MQSIKGFNGFSEYIKVLDKLTKSYYNNDYCINIESLYKQFLEDITSFKQTYEEKFIFFHF